MIRVRELVLPTCESRIHMLEKHKTLKLGVRDVLKLEKVVMANIMSVHLT